MNIYAAHDKNSQLLQVKVVDFGKGLNAVEFAQLSKALQPLGNANSSDNEPTTAYTSGRETGESDFNAKSRSIISTRLYISKQVVEKCGGSFHFSSPGEFRGCTFLFTIKVADAYESSHEREEEKTWHQKDQSVPEQTQNSGLAQILDQCELSYSSSPFELGADRYNQQSETIRSDLLLILSPK